jgi:hypothetical protein
MMSARLSNSPRSPAIMRVTGRKLAAMLAALVTVAATGFAATAQEAGPAPGGDYRVATPSGVVRIPRAEWTAIPSLEPLGESFQQHTIEAHHRLPRIVTVFKIHMTEGVRVGRQISPTDYLEMWIEDVSTLTVRIRADQGRYWLMSRETLLVPPSPLLDTSAARQLSDDEFDAAREIFGAEIEKTRFLLHSQFRQAR